MIRNFFKKKGDSELDKNREDHEAEIVDLAEDLDIDDSEQTEANAEKPDNEEHGAVQQDLMNKLLRLQADFDNYRKRTVAGQAESRKEGRKEVLLELLPIYDNFLRAMDHAEETEDYGSLRSGIQGILQQMADLFKRMNLLEIAAGPGTEFDPNHHDALGMLPGNADNHNTVAQEVLKGFELNGNVLRPSQVIVFNGE